MKDQELEQLMRDYEAEVAAYRRLPQSEPTALLDRAILTKARAAIAHAPPVRSRPPRWMAMAASFAGVAIAAGIGWRVYEARQADAASQADVSAPTAPREPAFEVEVLPDARRERGLDMAQLPAPPPPPSAPAAPQPQAFDEAPRAASETAVAAPAPEPAASMQKAIVPDPHQRSDHGGATALPERRQNLAVPAASAPMASEALGAVAAEAERDRAAAPTEAKRKEEAESPQAWLARIRQLVRDRRYTEARTELYRLRTRHPDVVIPPDLRRYAP